MSEDANDAAQVGHGVEVVEAAGRNEREEESSALAVSIAANEQPALTAYGDGSQGALGVNSKKT